MSDWNEAQALAKGRAAAPGLRVAQPRREGGRVRVYQGVRVATSADWHAMEREPNHCTRGEPPEGRDKSEHNGVDRVPPRATPEGDPWEESL